MWSGSEEPRELVATYIFVQARLLQVDDFELEPLEDLLERFAGFVIQLLPWERREQGEAGGRRASTRGRTARTGRAGKGDVLLWLDAAPPSNSSLEWEFPPKSGGWR